MKYTGEVYLLRGIFQGKQIYKYGATRVGAHSRLLAAKRLKSIIDIELVCSVKSKDPFASENNIKWNLQRCSAASEWFFSLFESEGDLIIKFKELATKYPVRSN